MSLNTHIDLTGLDIADAMAKITQELDRVCVVDAARLELCLLRDNFSREEIAGRVADYREELLAWREEKLIELRTWLQRDGASLH